MNSFKEGLKYDPNKKDIKGKKSPHRKYTSKEILRNRIIAVVLAGGVVATPVMAIRHMANKSNERKYISNFEEISENNIKAQDLNISPELYESVINFSNQIAESDLSEFSNEELSNCYSNLADKQLAILKAKVANLKGIPTSSFGIYAPTASGGEVVGTRICRLNERGEQRETIAMVKSQEIDEYMNDYLDQRSYAETLINGNVDREKLENKLLEYSEKLGEVMTINLLNDKKGNITSYRLEINNQQKPTNELQQETERG